jgi:hypothetical protein
MGEMGALNRENTASRTAWTNFYVTEATSREIVCLWWDNGRITPSTSTSDGFGIFNRLTNEFAFPEILEALITASTKE